MSAILPFIGPTYDQILAALRLNQPIAEQPRDEDTGQFVSPKTITRQRLERLTANLTPVQREACKARGSVRPVSDKGRARHG